MDIIRNITVPTGNICITKGDKGLLECLSIGDYGKENNIKADFLGLTKEINGVTHSELLPLEEKWVITISTQYGCSMGCTFCDVPLVGPGVNATRDDLIGQVEAAMSLHKEVTHGRINLHYARMGEPTWNPDVILSAYELKAALGNFAFHPVVSTMLPARNRNLHGFLADWLKYKWYNDGDAGLQFSINSTDEEARRRMFSGNAMPLYDVEAMCDDLIGMHGVKGRKIALNFALTGDEIDAKALRSMFSPEYFMCKITPIHATAASVESGLDSDGYDSYSIYAPVEEALKAEGFDVIVFVPSVEEDKSRITCGNAILSDTNRIKGELE